MVITRQKARLYDGKLPKYWSSLVQQAFRTHLASGSTTHHDRAGQACTEKESSERSTEQAQKSIPKPELNRKRVSRVAASTAAQQASRLSKITCYYPHDHDRTNAMCCFLFKIEDLVPGADSGAETGGLVIRWAGWASPCHQMHWNIRAGGGHSALCSPACGWRIAAPTSSLSSCCPGQLRFFLVFCFVFVWENLGLSIYEFCSDPYIRTPSRKLYHPKKNVRMEFI